MSRDFLRKAVEVLALLTAVVWFALFLGIGLGLAAHLLGWL